MLELITYRMGAHTNSDDPTRYVPAADLAAWKERDPIELFRARLRELGDYDDAAHQSLVDEVEARLERIIDAAFEHPVDPNDALDHVTAQDSPRLASERAELRARVAGAIGWRRRHRRRRRRRRRHLVASMTMLAAIHDTLAAEMERDERVILLGEDIGHNGGVFRVTDGLLDQFGDSRVFDTPISESAIIGASVGLSVAGLVPVAEIQFAGFSPQAYHQIVGQLSRMRYRSRSRFHCPVTVRSPYGGGVRTPEHHADSVEAPYTHTPGLKVVVPSTAADAKGLLAERGARPRPGAVPRAHPALPHRARRGARRRAPRRARSRAHRA